VFNNYVRKFANWKGEVRKNEDLEKELENDYSMNWWLYAQKPYVHQQSEENEEDAK